MYGTRNVVMNQSNEVGTMLITVVLFNSECYQKGLLKSKQVEETSDVESEEEQEPMPKKTSALHKLV
ncbi:hypothetical protein CHS0354_027957 [Potamilus streckersoni]|uniref:Uncharacterized protein n=1 Tax=Potamilus streckersoni TaxID=2493646 RepID=A0AAE0T4Q1_9BIVA|nr:hypothetical protein CHS0354_027957 [Potamilus streckersoni]